MEAKPLTKENIIDIKEIHNKKYEKNKENFDDNTNLGEKLVNAVNMQMNLQVTLLLIRNQYSDDEVNSDLEE